MVFCPCNSSYLLRDALSVKQVSVPLEKARMLLFLQPFLSDLLASHALEHQSFVLFSYCVLFLSLFFMVWLVLLCSRTQYASISLALL